MRAVIIDDEKKAREVLRILLGRHCPMVEVIGEAGNANAGLELIHRTSPDLVFLDIQMPGISGIEMLKSEEQVDYEVIFVTGHDKFVIEALRLNALDYLLKPVDPGQLVTAVNRSSRKKSPGTLRTGVMQLLITLGEKKEGDIIHAHHKGSVYLVKTSEVEYVEAKGSYAEVCTQKNKFIISMNLTELENSVRLGPDFVKANKSFIVNLHYVDRYTKADPCMLVMKSGAEIEVSRRKKTEILRQLRALFE